MWSAYRLQMRIVDQLQPLLISLCYHSAVWTADGAFVPYKLRLVIILTLIFENIQFSALKSRNLNIILKSFVFLDTVIEEARKYLQLKEFRFLDLDGNGELYGQKLINCWIDQQTICDFHPLNYFNIDVLVLLEPPRG